MPIRTSTISQPGALPTNYSKSRTIIVSAWSNCPWRAVHEFRLFSSHPKCVCVNGDRWVRLNRIYTCAARQCRHWFHQFCSPIFNSILVRFRQIGDASVTCKCPPGYKGNKCQLSEESSSEYTHFPIIFLFHSGRFQWRGKQLQYTIAKLWLLTNNLPESERRCIFRSPDGISLWIFRQASKILPRTTD